MSGVARARWALAGALAPVLLAALLGACSAPGSSLADPPGTREPSVPTSPPTPFEGPDDGPAEGPAEAESRGAPDRALDQPLVIAVHHTSPLHDLPFSRAREVVAGRGGLRHATGPPVARLRAVARDRDLVAVVAAEHVGPSVRVLRVDGVDPVDDPVDYPLRTAATTAQPPVVTVSVVGDIMLGRGVAEAARSTGDPAHALRPTARRLAAADVTVGNLENTLSRAGAPTQGGDSFAADPAVVPGLRDAGFDVLGLANNHLGDFGPRALVQTVRHLRAGGLMTFGAGATPGQAWRPAVVERQGVRLGFLGFNAIGETPPVGPGRPGAVSVGMPPRTGPLDLAALARFEAAVRRLDRRVDTVVVMPHWGTQYTNRPEPVQRRVARRLVAAGADVVVGGHPHWLQGAEMVDGRLVVHSLGNFVFDMDFMRQTREGAVLELTLWGGEPKAARFVPYVMDRRFAPRLVSGARGARVLAVMRATSGPAFRR